MYRLLNLLGIIMLNLFIITGCSDQGDPISPEVEEPADSVSWSSDIQPILQQNNCVGCHGGNGSLFLGSYSELMNGGMSGAVIVPGEADSSLLFKRISGSDSGERMPFGGPYLIQETIDLIRDWINEGALDN